MKCARNSMQFLEASNMINRRSQACIITFMGPVGVGKSTQIRLIKDYLKLRKIRATETFIKSNHVLAYILSKSLKALGVCEKVSYPGGVTRIYPRREVVRRLFPLWCFLDTLSISVKFFFTVYLPFRLGFTPLIEEGLIMTLHTYSMSFPHFFKTKPKVLPFLPSLLGWVTCKNHINVVLDATDDELSRRRNSRNYRQNELPEYISIQRKWIERLNFGNTVFIGTTGEPALRVHRKIVAALENCARTC